MFQLAVLADGRRLAVALRLGAVDAERRHRALRQELAEFLADRDQRREILDIAAGKGIFDHRDRRRAPRRRRDLALPISIWVSSTTVTILRMTALIASSSLFRHGPQF